MTGSRDPVEVHVADTLTQADLAYDKDARICGDGRHLDFYLPALGLYIEVTRFHTRRKIKQLRDMENVILIQGMDAAEAFRKLLLNSQRREEGE